MMNFTLLKWLQIHPSVYAIFPDCLVSKHYPATAAAPPRNASALDGNPPETGNNKIEFGPKLI